MKTTITISMRMAYQAYEAITDNHKLEEKLINEFPNIWIIKTDDPNEHCNLLLETIIQLGEFEVYADEYEIERGE